MGLLGRLLWRCAILWALLLVCCTLQMLALPADAQAANSGGRLQVNPNFLYSAEYPLINLMKTGSGWIYGDNSGVPGPKELDANGYPRFGANAFSHYGLYIAVGAPSQVERPGNYVMIWAGSGMMMARESGYGNGRTTKVVCTGQYEPGGNTSCDNTNCSAFTGSISDTTLTVTVASSCNLVVGQPISGPGIVVSKFGVPTIITGFQSGSGGAGTYTVNFAQSVASGSINPGGRWEFSVSNEVTTKNVQWLLFLRTTASARNPANTVQYVAFLHVDDEKPYRSGEIFSPLFKQRLSEGGFGIIRDLNWANANNSNCTTWATRRPAAYWSYQASELRESLFAGVPAHALRGGVDHYSVNFGTGAPVDKQTIIVQWHDTATTNTATLDLNGTGPVPIVNPVGNPVLRGYTPTAGDYSALVYDDALKGWLHFGGNGGLNCGMPPEAFIQLNAEMGTDPWIVESTYAADPITDFYPQYAAYIRDNHPNMVPVFEIPNETWNGVGGIYPTLYAMKKASAYAALDPAWKVNDFNNWVGKVGSLLGQAISKVYGGDRKRYKLVVGVHTYRDPKCCDARILSTSYMAQNPAKIPIQAGFTQSPAYKWTTHIGVFNYWNVGELGTQQEVARAYHYFYGSPAQRSEAMKAYMASALDGNVLNTLAADFIQWKDWNAWATKCAGAAPPCGIAGIIGYEGTYSEPLAREDMTVAVTGAVDGNPCVLKTTVKNGAVAGMPVQIANAAGGSWANVNGRSFTVQSSGLTSNAIPIDLDCEGLGSLTKGTLTYTGSKNYIDVLRSSSWFSSELETYSKLAYSRFLEAGGVHPSQFTIASPFDSNASWGTWSFDIYGYWPMATSSSASINGTTLTVGGTVTGQFQVGQTIMGGGAARNSIISALGTGTGGTGTYTLSQPSSVSGAEIGGYVTGPTAEWKAIVDWDRAH